MSVVDTRQLDSHVQKLALTRCIPRSETNLRRAKMRSCLFESPDMVLGLRNRHCTPTAPREERVDEKS